MAEPFVQDRVIELVAASLEVIRKDWRARLAEDILFRDSDLLGFIDRQIAAGDDLVSVWFNALSKGGGAEEDSYAPIVATIHSGDYNIGHFFGEVTHLKAAVERVFLSEFADSGVDFQCGTLRGMFRPLDELFGACLDRTSLVYEQVLELSHRGYCQLKPDATILYANGRMRELLGVDDARGLKLIDYFPTQTDRILEVLAGQYDRPVIARMELVTPTNKIPVNAEFGFCVLPPFGPGGFATITDIAHIAEAELRMFEKSQDAIVKADQDFCLTYVNPKAEALFGRTADELRGVSWRSLFPGEMNQREIDKNFEVRTDGDGSQYELTYVRADEDRVLPLKVSAMPEFNSLNERIGAMAIIDNLDVQTAANGIHRALEEETDLETMLGGVLNALRNLVSFELGIVGIYSKTLEHWRAIHIEPPPDENWQTRWFPVSDATRAWVLGPGPWIIEDLDRFLREYDAESLKEDPVVQEMLAANLNSLITLPIKLGDSIAGSITLSRKSDHEFTEEHHRLLRKTPVQRVVQQAVFRRAIEESEFLFDLTKRIGACSDEQQVASVLCTELAHYYDWQNVAVFRANTDRKRFEMVAQAEGPNNGFRLRDGHVQPITDGCLGLAYKEQAPKIFGNVHRDAAGVYVESNPDAQSELVLPILIEDEVVWLFNLEDSRLNAFCDEEIETLERVLREVRAFLQMLFVNLTQAQILQEATNGIVMTDRTGRILKLNPRAARLLGGKKRELKQTMITDYISEDDMKQFIAKEAEIAPHEVRLRKMNGEKLATRMSSSVLPTEFGRRVYFLDDVEALQRLNKLEALGGILYEIAVQTRLPLGLVSGMLLRLKRVADDGVKDVVDKAIRQLSKVEITYDRLLYCDEDSSPNLALAALNVRELLRAVRDEFPASDRTSITLRAPNNLPEIECDRHQMMFVLESILQYLLRFNPRSKKVTIRAEATSDGVIMRISGFARNVHGLSGDVADPHEWGRSQLLLSERVIRRFIVQNHRGHYKSAVGPDGRITFEIALPYEMSAAAQPAAPAA
jgi:PAS domain S-box-containing protein